MQKEELLQLAKDFLKTEAGKKLAGLDTDVENLKKQKDDVKQQLDPDQLKNRLKEYIPVLEKYKVKGRVYDKTTNTPIDKAKITPVLALGKHVRTDDKGQFTIEIEVPILPANNKALVQSQLLVNKEKYLPVNLEVLTSNRMVKSDIKTKPLVNIEKAAEQAIASLRDTMQGKVSEAQEIALNIFEKVIIVRRNAVYKLMNTILFKLLPLAVQMLLIFGITKASDLDKAVCPTPDQLKRAARTRNRIVRQLNQIYKMIAVNAALAAAFLIISRALKRVRSALEATPTGGGFPILKIQRIRELLDDLIKQNKNLNIQLLVALLFLVAALIIISIILKAIDQLLIRCSSDEDLVVLDEQLRQLAEETEDDAVTTTNQINGFILEVQAIDQNSVGNLKRRQAVGKNQQGVILVKGEPSFSAEDTVLINELAFYIQSNDLKAY